MRRCILTVISLITALSLAGCSISISNGDTTEATAVSTTAQARSSSGTIPEVSVPIVVPTTEAVTTEEATTEEHTSPVVTEESTTEVPTTETPTTEVPTTETPTTEVPTTETPTTRPVTTREPSTEVDLSKVIALTFDDGPATNGKLDGSIPCSTERILDTLEEYGAKATFFVQGINMTYAEYVKRNTALVKREYELGMQIGSHSYDHPNFNKLTDEEIQYQIDKSVQLISDATGGYEVEIIRTPGGAEKSNVLAAVDMPIILWNIDTRDWETKDAQKTYDEIMNKVSGGSIILMHDIYQTTADAVEMVVPALIEQGYQLVTINELFELYGVELEPNTVYYSAKEYHK